MGLKRQIYSTKSKHHWHLSYSKLKKMDYIYQLLEKERAHEARDGFGRYANQQILEERRLKSETIYL